MNLRIPYIEILNNISLSKQIMTATMERIMKGKREQKKWAVGFEEDLNVKRVRNCHAVARDGKACRKILLEAKVRNGGWCCGRKSGILTAC